jgi:hypothetical protein
MSFATILTIIILVAFWAWCSEAVATEIGKIHPMFRSLTKPVAVRAIMIVGGPLTCIIAVGILLSLLVVLGSANFVINRFPASLQKALAH